MLNIIRRLAVYNRAFLIASGAVLCAFQFVLCAIVASIDLPNVLNQFLAFAPPVVRTIIEQSLLGGSAAGLIAFAWNHPITHALVTAVAITLGSRAVAGEIESGAIELVLAQPVSRISYLMAHFIFAMFAIALVASAGLIGTMAGQSIFELHAFGWDRVLLLLASVFLLQMSFFSMTLLFSSFGREGGRVAILGVLVVVASLFGNAVATWWNKAVFLKPYSFHSYYDPSEILVNGRFPSSWAFALGSFIVVATAGAFARFLTRDLP